VHLDPDACRCIGSCSKRMKEERKALLTSQSLPSVLDQRCAGYFDWECNDIVEPIKEETTTTTTTTYYYL